MSLPLKKILLATIFNSSLLVFLFIGIQNSTNKSKVNLLFEETIELPISFILGSSFIFGSVIGNFLNFNVNNK